MNAFSLDTLKQEYIELFGEEGVAESVANEIENALAVNLPEDFRAIATFYGGGMVGGISHNSSALGPANNLVQETRRLREAIRLPTNFVVLAEPPESIILLDTDAHSAGGPAVIWLNATEVDKLPSIELLTSPDEWSTYSDFFAHLLRCERDERQ